MKKTIVIIILVITNLASLIYSMAQATIAARNKMMAEENMEMALTARDEAEVAQMRALEEQ